MRLKSFTAPTMTEAMELVRQELGDEAIIVSTQRAAGTKGVRITAALESVDADMAIAEMLEEVTESGSGTTDIIRKALSDHGVPQRLADRLINAARMAPLNDPTLACAAALEAGFTFAHLPEYGAPRAFMLIGPNGSGKSIAVAKLAARSVLKQRQVGVITCDNIRAGAVEQLAAFTSILEIDLVRARGPESLAASVAAANGAFDLVLVDSPGLNPFKQSDMDYLQALVEAADVEPILVMAAGGDAVEAAEIGEAFAGIGATRLFASRLDTTRRLGAVLSAAEAGQLAFCDVSASPHVASGIASISAISLARLMMPQPAETQPVDETFWTEAPTP
ncbi:GTP-binding signal recognition particle [Candidatus Terasakiella magnetica]|nr:GTP-binding signal recognition particle [Candidatus Terasakiella magnetica]